MRPNKTLQRRGTGRLSYLIDRRSYTMAIIERTYGKDNGVVIDEVLISSDSHVIEPAGLWQKELPKAFQDRAPNYGGQRPNDVPGGAQCVFEVSFEREGSEKPVCVAETVVRVYTG